MNFNSHAHVERDSTDLVNELNTADFNSHAHVERDIIEYLFEGISYYFNSHAHVERDGRGSGNYICCAEFQLTRSRGA